MTHHRSAAERVASLDTTLFDAIPTETTDGDRRSLLALQAAVAALGPYRYLEIGSHLGGTLQPHLADDRCVRAVSIDKRPLSQPDARGMRFPYPGNSTERMLHTLRSSGYGTERLHCIDGDVSDIDIDDVGPAPQLCLIDGEHTDDAARRDFAFCRSVTRDDVIIAFHDAHIVYNALDALLAALRDASVEHRSYVLPDCVFVIELGVRTVRNASPVRELLQDNAVPYLAALRANDWYRQFWQRDAFRLARTARQAARSLVARRPRV
jgi:hypothetical protein